jgi:two-component system, NtrC family, response regulator HydG
MSDLTTILVVDDNPPMTKTLQDILVIKGYEVYTAFSGAEALEVLRNQKIDILLTDVIMPEMDGVALYRKAKEIHPRLIGFLMTAYSHDDIIRQGMAEGIKTVLPKPIDINLFLSIVSAVERAYIHHQG